MFICRCCCCIICIALCVYIFTFFLSSTCNRINKRNAKPTAFLTYFASVCAVWQVASHFCLSHLLGIICWSILFSFCLFRFPCFQLAGHPVHWIHNIHHKQEHIQEVLDKWDQIDDEIWAKIIVFEGNRRVAKAYARAPILTINNSDDGFDGMR